MHDILGYNNQKQGTYKYFSLHTDDIHTYSSGQCTERIRFSEAEQLNTNYKSTSSSESSKIHLHFSKMKEGYLIMAILSYGTHPVIFLACLSYSLRICRAKHPNDHIPSLFGS